MNDKDIMEGILLTTKGVCDLYMHGSIESGTPNVHQAFSTALNDALCMQSSLYNRYSLPLPYHLIRSVCRQKFLLG